ncbi:MAG: hypothetical protein KDD69_02120 [Bdellovibrionales bacterium]|nr:hypothetical protein [Bdellovibrionales bacterium]
MRRDVVSSNVVLSLIVALNDPDVCVQEDAMVSLLRISPEEKWRVLLSLDDVANSMLARIARAVLERQLKAA